MASHVESWKQLAVDYKVYDPVMVGSIDGTDSRPHDRAIYRARDTKYHPNKQVKSLPRRTLFIGNLSYETNEGHLWDVFQKFGCIVYLRLVRDIVTGQSRRYAFLEYEHTYEAIDLLEKRCGILINGSEAIIEMEYERILPGWKPRRYGGGFGGQKESGQLRFGGVARPFKKPF